MNNRPRALVTGGAGFIGSHLVDELIKRGIETIVVDNLSTGSLENLKQHNGNGLLQVRVGDIKKISTVMSDVDNISVVFHEAAIPSVPKSVSDPMFVHDINVNGTLEVLNFCLKKKVEKFVFASSAAAYGYLEGKTASEELLCRPASPYGAGKLAVENYLSAYFAAYGLETVALRYFNVYGPRQNSNDYSGVITTFINNFVQGKKSTIFGDGRQTRDFVHVKDIVQANMLAMESDSAGGETFNVASGATISILELFELLKDIMGNDNILPEFSQPRPGDVLHGLASINKIRNRLGYSQGTSLREGLEELARYLKGKGANPVVYAQNDYKETGNPSRAV